MQAELDERVAIDVLRERARLELVANGVGQRGASAWRGLTLLRTHDLRSPGVQMEMKRLSLVLPQRLVIELAQDVPRNVAHHQADDLLFDSALAVVERLTNGFVEGCRRESRSRERHA